MDKPYDIQERSFLFACCIVDFCRPVLPNQMILRELMKQLLDSGTSIGANLEEADGGQSKPDFRSKIAISRKEAFETRFWLRLMVHADARLTPSASPLLQESNELIAILTTIKKNSETNDNRG